MNRTVLSVVVATLCGICHAVVSDAEAYGATAMNRTKSAPTARIENADGVRVLFLGNSITRTNGAPTPTCRTSPVPGTNFGKISVSGVTLDGAPWGAQAKDLARTSARHAQ